MILIFRKAASALLPFHKHIENEKSCCVLSKWSFVNWQITSFKPVDYKFVNWWITSCKAADYSKAVVYKCKVADYSKAAVYTWKVLHLHFVVLCVICQFTCVNQQFTHRQRLSLHSRSLELYKADYTCKCGWIDIASARASAIEVYMCKPVVYTCKLVVYRQRLSLHSRSLESYKADYTC